MINNRIPQLSIQFLRSRMVHASFEIQLHDALFLRVRLQLGEDVFRDAHTPVAFFHEHAFDFGVVAHDFYGTDADQLRAGVGTEHVGTTFEQDFDGVEVAIFPAVQFDLEGVQFVNEGLHLLIGGGNGGDGDRCHFKRLREVEVS